LNEIVLYPGNWLYNAGVVGFLEVLAEHDSSVELFWLRDDGTVVFSREVFRGFFAPVPVGSREIPQVLKYYVDYFVDRLFPLDFQKWFQGKDSKGRFVQEKYEEFARSMGGDFGYKFVYFWNRLFASNRSFQNLVQSEEWQQLEFAKILQDIPKLSGRKTCAFCGLPVVGDMPPDSKLAKRLTQFQHPHFPELGPSKGEFPNAFWNTTGSFWVCPFCVYLILHRDLSFTSLSDGTKVFVNAPSFKVMWYLNRLVKEVYSREKVSFVRELLGVSLIEFAMRVNAQLGMWTKMNIEVVSWRRVTIDKQKEDVIDFYVLPYQVADLLLDWRVASLLSDIGEFSVLKMVLEERFYEIVKLGERLMAIGMKGKNEWKDYEKAYIDRHVSLSRNKDRPDNLVNFASRLFSLYALIQEKQGVKGNER